MVVFSQGLVVLNIWLFVTGSCCTEYFVVLSQGLAVLTGLEAARLTVFEDKPDPVPFQAAMNIRNLIVLGADVVSFHVFLDMHVYKDYIW